MATANASFGTSVIAAVPTGGTASASFVTHVTGNIGTTTFVTHVMPADSNLKVEHDGDWVPCELYIEHAGVWMQVYI
jgi:hypothetical protein